MLFAVRADLLSDFGGDSVQTEQTRLALERLGVRAEVTDCLKPDLDGYDLVHLWHLGRAQETFLQARHAVEQGRPVVLSPIYWPTEEYERHGRPGLGGWLARRLGLERWETIKALGKWALTGSQGQRRALGITLQVGASAQRRWLLEHAEVLLPNSHAEARLLARRSGVPAERLCVVHNAIDTSFFRPPQRTPPNSAPLLYVGRIEPRKNLLAIIRAAGRLGRRLTVIGRPGAYAGRYFRDCRQAGGGNVVFIDRLPHRDLRTRYHQASASVNASWYETPGLANLEAAASGCRLVVTDRGCTQEYFGEYATYCDPSRAESIAEAIEQALRRPHDPVAQACHVAQFNWEQAARETLAGYRRCLHARRLVCPAAVEVSR